LGRGRWGKVFQKHLGTELAEKGSDGASERKRKSVASQKRFYRHRDAFQGSRRGCGKSTNLGTQLYQKGAAGRRKSLRGEEGIGWGRAS